MFKIAVDVFHVFILTNTHITHRDIHSSSTLKPAQRWRGGGVTPANCYPLSSVSGKIRDVAVFGRALSQFEVLQICFETGDCPTGTHLHVAPLSIILLRNVKDDAPINAVGELSLGSEIQLVKFLLKVLLK